MSSDRPASYFWENYKPMVYPGRSREETVPGRWGMLQGEGRPRRETPDAPRPSCTSPIRAVSAAAVAAAVASSTSCESMRSQDTCARYAVDMSELSREQVDATSGPLVLEFGASWCGYCQAARSDIDRALAEHPGVRHVWIEDGKGKRLGRTFAVKLWPTLVMLRDGHVVARVVRPRNADEVRAALAAL
jgi:thioredoxin 1